MKSGKINEEWKKTEIELPPKDGIYEVTNNPYFESDPFNREMISTCVYDGYGFELHGVYRDPLYWRDCKSRERRYGKVK